MTHIVSTIVLLLLLLGLRYRRERVLHRKLMWSAFALDMLLVLYIELSRGAVEEARGDSHPFVLFHITVSVAVVVLYLLQLALGSRLFVGREDLRRWHLWGGVSFLVVRILNYVTSFYVHDFISH